MAWCRVLSWQDSELSLVTLLATTYTYVALYWKTGGLRLLHASPAMHRLCILNPPPWYLEAFCSSSIQYQDKFAAGSDRSDAHVQRLRILEFTIDHEAPYFSRMRRRTSRRDSDLNGVVDVRYTGGARMLLLIEAGQGRWRFKVDS